MSLCALQGRDSTARGRSLNAFPLGRPEWVQSGQVGAPRAPLLRNGDDQEKTRRGGRCDHRQNCWSLVGPPGASWVAGTDRETEARVPPTPTGQAAPESDPSSASGHFRLGLIPGSHLTVLEADPVRITLKNKSSFNPAHSSFDCSWLRFQSFPPLASIARRTCLPANLISPPPCSSDREPREPGLPATSSLLWAWGSSELE